MSTAASYDKFCRKVKRDFVISVWNSKRSWI